ncbi:hypothetical protein LCGC14_1563930 [marine sediment metagenome]|uniref:ParB-like N-terminal domain-containing protein n=1 Tax=marine sediment metagenome TaxID=412755 RepID=A0A0F9LMA7_9ZZZZ
MDKDIRLCWILTKDLSYGAKPSDTNTEFYDKLLSSIKKYGIIEPILVINLPDKLLVKVGNSRLWCAKQLGIDKIQCVVVTLERDIDIVEIPEGEMITNIQSLFNYPIMWIERENYVALKCTHFHLSEYDVR